jgi:hypothetical protein
MDFWTVEVADAEREPARRWQDAYGKQLLEAALTHGAKDWAWVQCSWGVLLELGFEDEQDWLRWRATVAVRAALDAVPDPVNGIFVYSGRGGSSGAGVPRRPRPRPRADAAQLPIPEPSGIAPPYLPGTHETSLRLPAELR